MVPLVPLAWALNMDGRLILRPKYSFVNRFYCSQLHLLICATMLGSTATVVIYTNLI